MEELFVLMGAAVVFLGGIVMFNTALDMIGSWKMFGKAGEAGWKALIPFLNDYTRFNLYWKKEMFWVYLVLFAFSGMAATDNSIVTTIGSLCSLGVIFVSFKLHLGMAKCHGKGTGMAVLGTFFPGLCAMILGFDKSEYTKTL